MTTPRIAITGNTYPVKDHLRALGGRWDATQKAWLVPADRADEARALVAQAPRLAQPSTATYHPHTCRVCGHVERRNARGYPIGDRILKSGECQSCYEERQMGY